MVKNPHILDAFEKQEKKNQQPFSVQKDWFKKMDEMYHTAISLNPNLHKTKSEKHLEMLIEVRKKLNSIKNEVSAQ